MTFPICTNCGKQYQVGTLLKCMKCDMEEKNKVDTLRCRNCGLSPKVHKEIKVQDWVHYITICPNQNILRRIFGKIDYHLYKHYTDRFD